MRRRILDGQVVWSRQGCGPPWLLLHGFTGAPLSFAPLVARLPRHVGLLAVTLPGHGEWPPANPTHRFTDTVTAIATLLRRVGHPRVRVLGYSLGARVAFGLASLYPRQVQRLVALGGHPGLQHPVERDLRRGTDQRLAHQLRTEGLGPFMRRWGALPLFATQQALPQWQQDQQTRIRNAHSADQLATALLQLSLSDMPDWRSRLARYPGPVDLGVGAKDAKFLALNRDLSLRLPQARLHVFDNIGHNPVLEAPERVARVMI